MKQCTAIEKLDALYGYLYDYSLSVYARRVKSYRN